MAANCRKCNKEVKHGICKGTGKTSSIFGGRSPRTDCAATGKQCYNGHGKHWR